MASLRIRGWSVLFACVAGASLGAAACVGSVDRQYFDDAQEGGTFQSTDGATGETGTTATGDGSADADPTVIDGGDGGPDTGADDADAGPTFNVGGTVVGLLGTGLVLRLNGGDALGVPPAGGGANVGFSFLEPLASGASYSVAVFTQPSSPTQTCSVSGGDGTVGNADVTSVVVNCGTNTFTVGGNITGLEGSIVLKNNGGNDLTLTSNGSFAFSAPVASSSSYAVTIDSHSALPVQDCGVTNGTGSVSGANVTTVSVACATKSFTVGGTVSGAGGPITLTNNGGDDLVVSNDGGFTFGAAVLSNHDYGVAVKTAPAGKTCSVTNGAGTVTNANVNNVQVTCIPTYALVENFDGVTAPILPAGWTSEVLFEKVGGATALPFKTGTGTAGADYYSSPNAASVVEYAEVTDIVLTSPSFVVSSSAATLSFRHYLRVELPGTSVAWDGAVLEISVDGGSFQDITAPAAGFPNGGTFSANGYQAKLISSSYDSTIAGRKCWTGNFNGFLLTTVTLPVSSGHTVKLRWRIGTDNKFDYSGGGFWRIDSIAVAN